MEPRHRIRLAMGTNMTASRDTAGFTQRTLMALLTAQADRAELDRQIDVLTRALANANGLASYRPVAA